MLIVSRFEKFLFCSPVKTFLFKKKLTLLHTKEANDSLQLTFDMETSKYSTYQDFKWAIKLNRYILQLSGLWPKFEQSTWEKFMCNLRTLFIFLSILIVIVIPATHSLIRIYGDLMLMIDNLQFTLPALASMLKLTIFWWKKKDIMLLLNMIAKDWVKPKTSWERMIMITRAQTARIITMIGYGVSGATLFIATVMPAFNFSIRYLTNITDPGRPLPLQTYYIYDTTKSPQYEITFIFQSISIFLCIILYTGIDNFLGLLIFHICGQLDMLRNRITNLDKTANYTSTLKNCVNDHTRLLRAITLIEDIFNIMMLILFLYFGIVFAFYGFLILSLLEDRNHLSVTRVSYLLSVIISFVSHMCLYCAVGEILVTQCNCIHYAAYSNKWYNLELRNSRNIILLMIKTNEPFYLTAGGVFPLTMVTFCNLMKTSAGYISVLLTTRK